MMVAAFVAVFFTLLFLSGLSWYICLLISLVVAPIAGVVRLFSKRGTDTLTIPSLPQLLCFLWSYCLDI